MDQANIVAKIVKECLQGPDFSALKEEIANHEFVHMYWEVLKGHRETPTSVGHTKTKKILFINEASVIVQDVKLSVGSSRWITNKVYLADWHKVFAGWLGSEGMKHVMRMCWGDGIEMYRD